VQNKFKKSQYTVPNKVSSLAPDLVSLPEVLILEQRLLLEVALFLKR